MKLIFAILTLAVINVSAMFIGNHNGQPNCETDEELEQEKWGNPFDPTHYWLCEKKGEPAIEMVCNSGEAFDQMTFECVPWKNWKWKEHIEPPSIVKSKEINI